jgi:hypothetical protein
MKMQYGVRDEDGSAWKQPASRHFARARGSWSAGRYDFASPVESVSAAAEAVSL